MNLRFLLLVLFFSLGVGTSAQDFSAFDRDFHYAEDLAFAEPVLRDYLAQADTDSLRAEVYWRLSRLYLLQGEQAESVEQKRSFYNKGIAAAEEGIRMYPKNPHNYMWHSANVGRECQTHNLMEQAAAVPVMTKDLSFILEDLGYESYSAAWQALSELYFHHPFKSDDAAINYARKAATCVPEGELRLTTYIYLADLLYDRNWNSRKRSQESSSNVRRFADTQKKAIERYAYYDATTTPMLWMKTALKEVSDREEAISLLYFAKSRFEHCEQPTPTDRTDYQVLLQRIQKYSK